MTSGDTVGTSGGRGFRAGWATFAAFTPFVVAVNALSQAYDAERDGAGFEPAWIPWALEGSSAVVLLILAPLVWRALRLAAPHAWTWRWIAVHAAAALVFSILHVVGMVLIRDAVWFLAGIGPYDFDVSVPEFVYEFRKDLITYSFIAAIFWAAPRVLQARADAARPGEAVVELQDGARTLRFRASAIVAAEAQGNYVELALGDGRRPLVRTTLAAALERLGPHGFVRTHRSWIVAADRVVSATPTGAGDQTLTLEGGLAAPLSRRYGEAADAIRVALAARPIA